MKKSFGVIVFALVVTMSFAGVALAEEVDDDTESMAMTPVVIVDEEGVITIAIPIDGELPEGCLPDDSDEETPDGEGVDEGGDDDGEEVADPEEPVSYGPGDCIEFVIDHPSGKTHHGAVVSTVAKNLHPSMLDGVKKGEIMRMVAKTGKIDDGDDGDDGDEPKAEKEKKEKKDKSNKDRGNSDNAKNKENPGRENSKAKKNG